jgi:hypothetical protein
MTQEEFIESLKNAGFNCSLNKKTGELTIRLGGDSMMEKYGVDLSELPATDDQLKELKKIAKALNVESVEDPKNRVHAEELIKELRAKIPKGVK